MLLPRSAVVVVDADDAFVELLEMERDEEERVELHTMQINMRSQVTTAPGRRRRRCRLNRRTLMMLL